MCDLTWRWAGAPLAWHWRRSLALISCMSQQQSPCFSERSRGRLGFFTVETSTVSSVCNVVCGVVFVQSLQHRFSFLSGSIFLYFIHYIFYNGKLLSQNVNRLFEWLFQIVKGEFLKTLKAFAKHCSSGSFCCWDILDCFPCHIHYCDTDRSPLRAARLFLKLNTVFHSANCPFLSQHYCTTHVT